MKKNGDALKYASDELKGDRDVVLAAVTQNGHALKYASDELKGDKDVVLAALQHVKGGSYDERRYSIHDVCQAEVPEVPVDSSLQKFWKSIYTILNLYFKSGPPDALFEILKSFSNETECHNRSVVLNAVRQNGLALEHASEDLQNDSRVLSEAVTQNGDALMFASNILKTNKEVVLAAVRQKGKALEYASDGLKDDRVVVLAAIEQNEAALEFASNRLQDSMQTYNVN